MIYFIAVGWMDVAAFHSFGLSFIGLYLLRNVVKYELLDKKASRMDNLGRQ